MIIVQEHSQVLRTTKSKKSSYQQVSQKVTNTIS